LQKHINGLWFRLMALEYRLRAEGVLSALERAGIRPGTSVVDFGCGPGRYTLPAARMVGAEGTVYALDVHPLAVRMVEKKARRQGLGNVRAIRTDCDSSLPPGSIDVVLLFNALHDVEDKESVLAELHRVLKKDGRILYTDHALFGDALDALMKSGGFRKVGSASDPSAFEKI
jgi:ubiquinone/menaquinone biosynthesis C-methylase UbiE